MFSEGSTDQNDIFCVSADFLAVFCEERPR